MRKFSIFVVDDERAIRTGLSRELSGEYDVTAFAGAGDFLGAVKQTKPDVVLLDIGLPDMNGLDVLKKIKALAPDILVIMITAYEDIDTVVSAMKLGAHDYVLKPLYMDSLVVTISNALETIRLRKEVQVLQEKFLEENLPCFVGESNSIQDVMEFIGLVAKSPDTPVLIMGETGTGKELVAGAIHYRSPNFKGPFITVNCAAIPGDLVESELFGYEKGAFSGALTAGKKGLIDAAAGGTLFLDEVGDLSAEAQAKLLRFLEDGAFFRVGGTRQVTVRTRIVSATNKDLETLIEHNRFRKDLFFRLSVVKVKVPSLNDRSDDILPLANHFLMEFCRKFGKSMSAIAPDARQALLQHTWSGNVRELKNLIERGVLIGKGTRLSVRDLDIQHAVSARPETKPDALKFPPLPPGGIDINSVHKAMEEHYIEEALRISGGNKSRAARLLNLNRHTLRYRRKSVKRTTG